ncbi:PEP-CTERM sorting domain-containing protein [uncultured Akkermansia sp.]|uniref:PEP-CTERM sorting domain-containing protein n=1 Tax=uncultured Akkermansia sp. TaxID=512294 RepID=UPI00265D5A95|nr:PEP-CTERM sorting domain-containing protein [uncultured Akkermansia sp.]
MINSLGQSLNEGKAILGAFNSDSWSYEKSQWKFEGKSYNQDELTYSQLVDMQNSFTSTLAPESISEEQDGTVTNGTFTLNGIYKTPPSSLTTPVYLMVTGKTGELAVFVFRSVTNDSVLTYENLNLSNLSPLDLCLLPKTEASAGGYYMDCILGNVDRDLSTIQLLVPEPATATLGLLGLAALMTRRRRR